MNSLLAPFNWNVFGSTVLSWVGQAMLYGTLTAVAAWALLSLTRKRISPAIQGLFWTVVLVKFIVPVGPGSLYSLATIINRTTSVWNSSSIQPQGAAGAPASQIFVVVEDKIAGAKQVASPITAVEAQPPWSVSALCGIAYLIIVVGIAAWRIAGYVRFARRCRTLPKVDEDARRIVDGVCEKHGVRRLRDVRISGDVAAPFILGGLRPLLVLSPRQTQPDELEAVVLHEIAHLRRRDLIVRYVQWFAGTMLFFWPVVAWVNRRIDLAREHACDDWALRHGCLSAGDYARCLLRALHRPEPIRLSYRPAAMARNLKSVERRIDMIMDSPRQRSFRSLTLPTLLALAAWSAFALSGAKADDPKKTESTETQKEDTSKATQTSTEVQVVRISGEEAGIEPGGPMDVKVVKNDQGQMEVQINGKIVHNLDIKGVKMKALGGGFGMDAIGMMSPRALEQFGKDHPTADADGDGKVTLVERNAFIAALAQSIPVATLNMFPEADLNKNGVLDSMEIARLVTDNGMDIEEFECTSTTDAAGSDAASGKQVMVVRKAVALAHSADGESVPLPPPAPNGEPLPKMAFAFAGPTQNSASKWLLDNIKSAPTTADVAKMIPVVEEAPLVRYAEKFPDADINKDGKVSKEERKAHMEKQMSDVRARMLKRHPEADKDGDGVLSVDEEREYFRKAAQRTGMQTARKGGVFVQKGENGGPEMMFDIQIATDGDDVDVSGGDVIIQTEVEHVEVIGDKADEKTGEKKETCDAGVMDRWLSR